MPVATSATAQSDKLNTVAVLPLLAAGPSRSLTFLRSAASNLIHAIAQGSSSVTAEADAPSDDDEGSSSFTYAATQASSNPPEWYAQVPWHISNRYYDVDVTLKAYCPELLSTQASTSRSDSDTLTNIPAYVVLVDRSSPLEDHRRNIQQMESAVISGFDAEISIVAGISAFSSSSGQILTGLEESSSNTTRKASHAPSVSDLVTLYSDAGWEFIAIDDDEDAALGTDNGSEDDDGVEQDGIDRIREALQNYMWNGLRRKPDDRGPAFTNGEAEVPAVTPQFSSLGFSHALDHEHAEEEEADEAHATESTLPVAVSSTLPDLSDLGLGSDSHAAPGDLDEQLAKMFLSSRNNLTDLADLEAFLESEDPSWPAGAPSTSLPRTDVDEVKFDNNFDDFLPFQSAEPASANADKDSTDEDLFPDESEIEHMQSTLFGSKAVASDEHDLGSHLHQLQWHAERVRNITDPDKRRKEAALIALAFSMQWGTDGPDSSATTTTQPKLQF